MAVTFGVMRPGTLLTMLFEYRDNNRRPRLHRRPRVGADGRRMTYPNETDAGTVGPEIDDEPLLVRPYVRLLERQHAPHAAEEPMGGAPASAGQPEYGGRHARTPADIRLTRAGTGARHGPRAGCPSGQSWPTALPCCRLGRADARAGRHRACAERRRSACGSRSGRGRDYSAEGWSLRDSCRAGPTSVAGVGHAGSGRSVVRLRAAVPARGVTRPIGCRPAER